MPTNTRLDVKCPVSVCSSKSLQFVHVSKLPEFLSTCAHMEHIFTLFCFNAGHNFYFAVLLMLKITLQRQKSTSTASKSGLFAILEQIFGVETMISTLITWTEVNCEAKVCLLKCCVALLLVLSYYYKHHLALIRFPAIPQLTV